MHKQKTTHLMQNALEQVIAVNSPQLNTCIPATDFKRKGQIAPRIAGTKAISTNSPKPKACDPNSSRNLHHPQFAFPGTL